jgi:hypothetical protein
MEYASRVPRRSKSLWSGQSTGISNGRDRLNIHAFPPLDFCFICRKYLGDDKHHPHLCGTCLGVIQGGVAPVSVIFQELIDDE